jgi:hypothetical protein
MKKEGRKYIYLSNLDYSGTVFQTQILDWLNLYKDHNLEFDLIQAFHVKDLKRPGYLKKQLTGLRESSKYYAGSLYLFPSKNFLYIVNALIIFCKILKYVFKYNEVLIFSRAIIGKEIAVLRKISPVRIIFYFDARAAAAEENKYVAALRNDYSLQRYIIIANIYFIVYQTLLAADKVFVVSNVLQKYFQDTYNLHYKKFVPYPCLSDSRKFYYDSNIRNELRSALGIGEAIRVLIYSGGLDSEWHITEKMFTFMNYLLMYEKKSMLICLTKNQLTFEKILNNYPEVKPRILSLSVPNHEVYKYLNAADYGILFRENTIMNNVASPTKFAEYILCGLPVLISEGVGDYSNFTKKHNLGVLIRESELNDSYKFDFNNFLRKTFDRKYISDFGRKNFSKDSVINNLIGELLS